MAGLMIKKRDAKTGNKKERTVRRLTPEEMAAGTWARSTSGTAHHFFIDGTSICGRQPGATRQTSAARILCPECFASTGRGLSYE